MKPSAIFDIMDLALEVRANKQNFVPLFVGPPGVGKSEIVQQWAKARGMPLLDLRIAYKEAPDMVGFPQPVIKNGKQVTTHYTPDEFPTEGKGVILLEEPNRGTTSVMNTLMQLLTDRKIGPTYDLPEGWIIAACINPEGTQYDVNTMDAALKNRFVIFEVDYDKPTLIKYMKEKEWAKPIIDFISSSFWKFETPEKIAESGKYVSPRTWSQLNSVEQAGVPDSLRLMMYTSILGNNVGRSYYNFACEDAPVSYIDLLDDKTRDSALSRLKKHSDVKNYQGDKLSITTSDILDNARKANLTNDEIMRDVLMHMSAEQGYILLKDYNFVMQADHKSPGYMDRLIKLFPEIKKRFKQDLKDDK